MHGNTEKGTSRSPEWQALREVFGNVKALCEAEAEATDGVTASQIRMALEQACQEQSQRFAAVEALSKLGGPL